MLQKNIPLLVCTSLPSVYQRCSLWFDLVLYLGFLFYGNRNPSRL